MICRVSSSAILVQPLLLVTEALWADFCCGVFFSHRRSAYIPHAHGQEPDRRAALAQLDKHEDMARRDHSSGPRGKPEPLG